MTAIDGPAASAGRQDACEVLWDEDEEYAFTSGHIPSVVFVAAVVRSLIEVCDDQERAMVLLDRFGLAARRVTHVWLRDLGPDTERMEPCVPDHPEAQALTQLHVYAVAP